MKPATPEEDREWKAVKEAYGKVSVPVVADESICSAEDVIAMKVKPPLLLSICLSPFFFFFLSSFLSLFLLILATARSYIFMKQDYVHGVNVKMEKAGGIRGALKAIDKARELGLQVWVGVMVASSLNSNAAGM